MRQKKSRKVKNPKELARLSESMRAEGKKLVLTNGCFDLLHVGHIRYLKAARALGDALAVALNTDESVRRIKGPERPLNRQDDRLEVLTALADVDFVTVFDEGTASRLVATVRPAVYVKGGDYSDDPASPLFPAEGEVVRGYGGEVRTVEFVPGYSTTSLLNRAAPATKT